MAVTSLRRKKIYHTILNPSISDTLHMGNTLTTVEERND